MEEKKNSKKKYNGGQIALIVIICVLIVGGIGGGVASLVRTNSTQSAPDLQDKSFFIQGVNSLIVTADKSYDALGSVTVTTSDLEGYIAVHVFNCGDRDGDVCYYHFSGLAHPSCEKGEYETFYEKKGSLLVASADVVRYKNAVPFTPPFLDADAFITDAEQNIPLIIMEESWIALYPKSGSYVDPPEAFLPFDDWE